MFVGADCELLIDPELNADFGSNYTGLYELIGLVTHTGGTMHKGRWTAWKKKDEQGIITSGDD
jgi:ubiquitin carboxyl-terminal hydrolase 14